VSDDKRPFDGINTDGQGLIDNQDGHQFHLEAAEHLSVIDFKSYKDFKHLVAPSEEHYNLYVTDKSLHHAKQREKSAFDSEEDFSGSHGSDFSQLSDEEIHQRIVFESIPPVIPSSLGLSVDDTTKSFLYSEEMDQDDEADQDLTESEKIELRELKRRMRLRRQQREFLPDNFQKIDRRIVKEIVQIGAEERVELDYNYKKWRKDIMERRHYGTKRNGLSPWTKALKSFVNTA